MSILTIAYVSNVIDGKILIMNSQDDKILSNNPRELVTFLAKNYTDATNRKLCWDLDSFMSVILQRLGMDVCKQLIIQPDCEALLTFGEDGEPVIHPLTDKPEKSEDGKVKPLPDGMCAMYYHPKTSVGLQVGGERKSYFYNLSQFFEDDIPEAITLEVTLAKAKELVDAFFAMGLNPFKMSSPVSVFQSNVLDHITHFPTTADIPNTLREAEIDELKEWAEDIMHREWTTNFAVGRWNKDETYNYDVQSSYGYHFSQLYDFKYATFAKITKADLPAKGYTWGILKGKVTINPDVICSPICYKRENGQTINPVGVSWDDKITLADARFIYQYKIGTFDLDYGYVWKQNAPVQPFKVAMERIFNKRELGGLSRRLAKRIGASAWGKVIQSNISGEVNKYSNPIFGCQVKTHARLQVAKFIYDNGLQDSALYVATDGVRTTKRVDIPQIVRMGAWRLDTPEECIILSPGSVHSPTHHPQSLYYDDIIKMIEANPKETYYSKSVTRRLTLDEAVLMNDLKHIGELKEFPTSIDLFSDMAKQDYVFKTFPRCGSELISNKYYGEPVRTLD